MVVRALTLYLSGCRHWDLVLSDTPLLLLLLPCFPGPPLSLSRLSPPYAQDFFVVCFFLAWLVVALVPHFAYHNEVLLDAWLSLWTLVIQPLLGVLMLGTIVAGTLSYVQSKEEITTM